MHIDKSGGAQAQKQVKLRKLNSEAEPVDMALVSLKGSSAECDNQELMTQWQKAGILGRPEFGRVFPQDGARFLEELPYMYRSNYLWAEQVKPPQG